MLTKINSRLFLNSTIIKTCINPSFKLKNHSNFPSQHIQLTSHTYLLTNYTTFSFSSSSSPSPLPQSSLIPLVYRLRKQANELKIQHGQSSEQHLQTLHHLAIVLAQYSFLGQAITVAQSIIKYYQQNYNKLSEKTYLSQFKRILYHRFLIGLHKTNKDFNNYFKVSDQIIKQTQRLALKQPELSDAVIELYIDAGETHFELQNYGQALKALQMAVNLSPKQQNNLHKHTHINRRKILQTNNMIGHILLHHNNQLEEALQVLNQNLSQIQKIPTDKLDHSLVSHCILVLTQAYAKKLPNLTIQQTNQYLKSVNTLIKSVQTIISKKQISNKTVLTFYQNLSQLHLHTKNYSKALQCYRLQRQQIAENDSISLALCYENQAKIHETTKKIQKAIQKLNKSLQKRQKIHGMYANKKRKTPQEQAMLNENKRGMIETSEKLIELHKKIKNNKKVQQWTAKHETFLSL